MSSKSNVVAIPKCLGNGIYWYNSNQYVTLSTVLGRKITLEEARNLYKDWHEFFIHPADFTNTIVVDMVLQYLND